MPVLPEKPSVLLADADPTSATILSTLLESWNYQVEVIADGAAAYKRLNSPQPPELAIVDYELPSMKGFEVIAETRRRSRQHAPWLMLMSGAADLEKIEMATKAGVDDFLLKPVNEMDLLVRLRTAERVQHLYHELQEQMQAVRFHASHDSLTGLLNREAMMRLLFQETDRVQRMRTPLTLMLIDLDKFSDVNIEFGYGTGDVILREFSQRLRRYLRSYDILGRCGEDEFLVGLPGCLAEQAATMADRLQTTVLEKPYHIHRDVLSVTASIGIATSRGRSPLIVLREAERALGNAKLAGRNCIRCYGQPAEPIQVITDSTESDQPISPS
ncbi:diguanylate cyclase [Alloacidobacterium dinghuense]|uniref:diguanylate cyclase n=1 Tax=Alloacidobacterium dinghuense TaxID=2763107 RepID=A0A7G8BKP2_9BACT|nr:diguanylate cyclase [Alloacidobacterium dinghuense]QNI33112.1 diguanylate cyclase [Alloacidobacterium dinghuense]